MWPHVYVTDEVFGYALDYCVCVSVRADDNSMVRSIVIAALTTYTVISYCDYITC